MLQSSSLFFLSVFPPQNCKKIHISWYPDWLCPSDLHFRVFSLLSAVMTTSTLNTGEKRNVVSLIKKKKKNKVCLYTHIYMHASFSQMQFSSKDDIVCNTVSLCISHSSFPQIFILPSLINLKMLSTPAIFSSMTGFNNISLFIYIY